jgi:hypothetical protein
LKPENVPYESRNVFKSAELQTWDVCILESKGLSVNIDHYHNQNNLGVGQGIGFILIGKSK